MTAPCDVLKNLPKRPIAFLAFQKWKTTLEVMINEGGGAKFEVCVFVNFYFYFTKLICTTFRNDFQNCSLRTALKFTQTAYSLNSKHSKHKYVFNRRFERKQNKCFSNRDY